MVFNLRGLLYAAVGLAVWVGVTAAGAGVFLGALVGSLVTVALDLVARVRAGRTLMSHTAGGMFCLIPVWILGLVAVLAAVLIETALPEGWDRPRPRAPMGAHGSDR
jgi:hypothetical protein